MLFFPSFLFLFGFEYCVYSQLQSADDNHCHRLFCCHSQAPKIDNQQLSGLHRIPWWFFADSNLDILHRAALTNWLWMVVRSPSYFSKQSMNVLWYRKLQREGGLNTCEKCVTGSEMVVAHGLWVVVIPEVVVVPNYSHQDAIYSSICDWNPKTSLRISGITLTFRAKKQSARLLSRKEITPQQATGEPS